MSDFQKLLSMALQRDARLLKIAYELNREKKRERKKIIKDNQQTDHELMGRFI